MAFSDDIENEGAIDTGDDNAGQDNSGAAPVVASPDDNSGAAPVVPPAPAPQRPTDALQAIADAGKQTPLEGIKQFPGNVKRIISYLTGAGADNPAALDQVGQQVDPRGQLSPSDRNLLAIDHAHAQGGEEAAWKLLQANRVAYNAKQAFAKVAMTGTPQKPPDLNAAIDAANQAQAHVLDGSNVHFAPSQGGVTATVTMPGTTQPQQISLTPEQFAQWVDVGGAGQYDKVMESSVPATLQKIASSAAVGQPAPRKQPSAAPAAPAQQPKAPAYNPQPQRTKAQITGQAQVSEPGAEPAIPGTHDANGHYLGPRENTDPGYGEELERRSKRIFGEGGVGPSETARQQWMAAQEEKELARDNEIKVAGAKGEKAKEVAEIQGGWRFKGQEVGANAKVKSSENYSNAKVQQAQIKLQAEIAREEARDRHSDKLVAMKGLNAMLLGGYADRMNPQQKQMFESLTTGQGQTPTAPQKQAPAQGAGDIQAAPPDASQRVVGQKYKSTTGKIGVWTGKGWQVQ